ncbi:hypothetical protein MNBD_GAMMA14-1003 [hydrothermal vent metagenome]|uniref:DUF3800 domain-containing protein n=1 Tax=hydrothermal vent metagenome TaxID=652676 RepID=A0A3B0Y9M7_9ZZZZ
MKLIFFDEVKPEADYPHYHIGAVCIDEEHLHNIEAQVSSLADEIFGKTGISRETEFHAVEIFHRKKFFKGWSDFSQRIGVLDRLIQILSLEDVALIDIQINSDLLSENQSAEEIAFMFLCERANDYVKTNKSLGMLIGDRESDRMSEQFATTLSGYRANGTDFAFGRDLTHLVDSVHFTHSHLSRFLQLADVYAWMLQFRVRNRGSENHRHQAIFEILGREGINLFPSKYKEWPKYQ